MTAPPVASTMSADDIKTGVLVLIVIGVVIFRLMQRHQVSKGFLIAAPVILLFFGIDSLSEVHDVGAVGLLAVCLVLEFLLGLWLGRSFTMWREQGDVWLQGTTLTLVLWLGAFGLRFVFVALAHILDLEVTEGSEILISLAFTFAGQDIVIAQRAGFLHFDRADPPANAERL